MNKTCYHCISRDLDNKDLQKVKAGFWLCSKCAESSGINIYLESSSNILTSELVVDMIIEDIKENPSMKNSWLDMDDLGQIFTRMHWINLIKPFL